MSTAPRSRNTTLSSTSTVGQALRAALGSIVTLDPAVMESYRRDEAVTVEAGVPAAVVLPASTSEVQEALRIAERHKTPVVARGAGSGLSGGATATDGCVVISFERMNRILALDSENLYATVEPGVINADLDAAAGEVGLCYAPDPASRDVSTLGGNIATNAGGLCCLKYGVTRDSVLGLKAVLADGSELVTGRRTLKGVAGYDLTALLVGSEGTLGLVTEATLRLRPRPPTPATLVAFFPTITSAGTAISHVRRYLVPALLEILDRYVIASIESWKPIGLDVEAAAMVIAQSDVGAPQSLDELTEMQRLFNQHGATFSAVTADSMESEVFLAARKLAFPALRRQGTTILDDVSVPYARLPQLLASIEEAAVRFQVSIATFGHAGDGNMHPTIIFDAADQAAKDQARAAFAAVVTSALDLGGTVTGEHGVGLLKRDFLRQEIGDAGLHVQRGIKSVFDPNGILNRGKVL